jgi:hypothetical protein
MEQHGIDKTLDKNDLDGSARFTGAWMAWSISGDSVCFLNGCKQHASVDENTRSSHTGS